jgi:3-dehydrosphinganine reductase
MKAQRPSRGRVSKPSAPAGRGGPRRQAGAQLEALAEHQLKVDHTGQDPSVFDDGRMGPEQYAAAAAAASMMDADMGADGQGDAEAEADMDDDDPTATTSGLGPHVDLSTAAANILANGGQPVDDQHQDLQQGLAHHQQPADQMGVSHLQQAGQSMDPSLVQTTQELAIESGYDNLNIESALAKRLAREPGHRHATQRRPEQILNLARRSNVEALFAHIAGEPARVPCKNCHKGHGPWVSCIVVDGQMCGSCANCWFNASGARCSFHETRNIQHAQQHPAIMTGTSAGLPADQTYRFATPHSLVPPAPGPSLANLAHHTTMFTNNPMLQQMIARAMNEVRGSDKATRQLLQIDIAAKQLALQLAEYEEMLADANQDGQGQQVMGDEPRA